jgi:DNA-binding SARP family transcriptional activator
VATSSTTRLRFRLLGPLEVLRDGQPVPLGGERQRGLLALLLLHANELVTTEHLAEQLFGAEASEASIRAVRVAVSRLRRLLADETLATGAGGYLARADPDQLDVAEFESLVAEGRAALDARDAAAAAAAFRSALALFRGPPLADLALLDFVQPEARRLEELRLSALMDGIDADLALGSGGELVPEIEALVQANPFQERLRGQLMLALYRSGRQSDALEVYRDTRELLADELGLEPSRALQQLERAMLQHDPALDVAGAVAAPAEAATCPFKGLAAFEAADAFYFCGRECLLDEIVTRLASATFLGIVGPSGVGKSSLLRAGVLPALAAGALPGSATWPVVLVRGGDHAATTVHDAVGEFRVGERVVIAVDQLEEIFADDVPADERTAFFEELEGAAADPATRALVLVAVRADFYGRFADHPRIADRLSQSHIFVRSLDRTELASAIEVPAARSGLAVEPSLVDALCRYCRRHCSSCGQRATGASCATSRTARWADCAARSAGSQRRRSRSSRRRTRG